METCRDQPESALKEDWDNTWPIIDVFRAFHHGRIFLGLTLIGTVLTIGYTIMLGTLQVSASFYGATTFHADLDGVIAVVALNSYLLLLSFTALVVYVHNRYKERGWIKGANTMSELLVKILWSDGLRADVREGRRVKSKSAHQYRVHLEKHQPLPGRDAVQKIDRV